MLSSEAASATSRWQSLAHGDIIADIALRSHGVCPAGCHSTLARRDAKAMRMKYTKSCAVHWVNGAMKQRTQGIALSRPGWDLN